MKRNLFLKMTMLVLMVSLLAGSVGAGTKDVGPGYSMGPRLEAISLNADGLSEIRVTVMVTSDCIGCREVLATVEGDGGLEFVGETTWTVDVTVDTVQSRVIQVRLPHDTVSSFYCTLESGDRTAHNRIYFDTRKNPIWWGNKKPGPRYTRLEQKRMRIGEAKLKEQVCISMDFRHGFGGPSAETIDSLLGGKLLPTDTAGVYTARTSLDTSLWLAHERRVLVSHLPDSLCSQLTPPPTR